MPVLKLDHVNIRTANLPLMIEFYENVVGLEQGERPPFPFPGGWLYCGGQAVVHLVGVTRTTVDEVELSLEHFAFSARDLKAFLGTLDRFGVPHDTRRLPEWGHWQVNFHDPDGNHLHVDFPPDEQP